MAWHARCVGRRRDSGAADAGPRDVGPLGRRLTLTLDPTIDGESEDPPKATSITSADLLDPNGVVLAAASILDGAAVFDLAHVRGTTP